MGIKHIFTSAATDPTDATKVRASNWNSDHTIDGDVDFNGFDIVNAGNISASFDTGWINVKDAPYNAVGDGVADDTTAIQAALDAAIYPTVNNSQAHVKENIPVRFPAGTYKITSQLFLPQSGFGVTIFGDGCPSTTITSSAANGAFYSNGFRNSVIRDLQIIVTAIGSTAVCWDLDFDNTGSVTSPTDVTFENCWFSGTYNDTVGIRIGNTAGGTNNSEHRFINCVFDSHLYGLQLRQFNNLNIAVEDGGATNCVRGYYVRRGAIGRIENTANAGNDIDIYCEEGQQLIVTGCRTESDIFISFIRGTLQVIGCKQESGGTATFFVKSGAAATDKMVTLIGCVSDNGQIQLPLGSGGGSGTPPNLVMNCQFGRDDYFVAGSVFRFSNLEVGKWDGGAQGTGTYTILKDGLVGAGSHEFGFGDQTFPEYRISNTHAGTGGPVLSLYHNSASPAVSDNFSSLDFFANDSGGNRTAYTGIDSYIIDPTDGSEDGRMELVARVAGTVITGLQVSNGIILGTATTFPGQGNLQMGTATHAFSNLPGSPAVGMIAYVSDSNTATHGATVAAGGANKILAWYNGTNWTVMGS